LPVFKLPPPPQISWKTKWFSIKVPVISKPAPCVASAPCAAAPAPCQQATPCQAEANNIVTEDEEVPPKYDANGE